MFVPAGAVTVTMLHAALYLAIECPPSFASCVLTSVAAPAIGVFMPEHQV